MAELLRERRRPYRKTSPEISDAIERDLRETSESMASIARKYGVSKSVVQNRAQGRTWTPDIK